MSKIKIIRKVPPLHSPEWYAMRLLSIGASEVGAVLGLSPYKPAARLFCEKIGMMEDSRLPNKFIYWGLELEDLIANAWKFYDGGEDSYIMNKDAKKVIRDCKKINGFFVNSDYPHLSATPDRMMVKNAFRLTDNAVLGMQCPLEIKTISEWESKNWEAGIPVFYLAQVHAQMICTGTEYSEIAMLKSGRHFEVVPVVMSAELRDIILEKTTDFWNNRVLPAKKLMAELQNEQAEDKKEAIHRELHDLEPAPEDTPAYSEFLSERYHTKPSSRPPTDEEHEWMVEYERAQRVKKVAEGLMLGAKNKLINNAQQTEVLEDHRCKMIHRNEEGKRSYFSVKLLSKSDSEEKPEGNE